MDTTVVHGERFFHSKRIALGLLMLVGVVIFVISLKISDTRGMILAMVGFPMIMFFGILAIVITDPEATTVTFTPECLQISCKDGKFAVPWADLYEIWMVRKKTGSMGKYFSEYTVIVRADRDGHLVIFDDQKLSDAESHHLRGLFQTYAIRNNFVFGS